MNNQEKILQCAALEMAKFGYHAVSMDTIVEKTGIAKSNVYYHFQTKEELGLNVLKFWVQIWQQLYAKTINNHQIKIPDRIDHLFARIITFQQKVNFSGPPIILISSEIDTPEAKKRYLDANTFFENSWANFIKLGQQNKIFGQNLNPKIAASLIVDLTNTSILKSKITKDVNSLLQTKATIFSILIKK